MLAPISITLYVLYLIFEYVDGLLEKTISSFLGGKYPWSGDIGYFCRDNGNWVFRLQHVLRPLLRYFDKLINKAPFVRIIYSAIKDFFTAFVGQKKKRFNEPVLVKVNKESDLQKLGFVTNRDLKLIGIEGGKLAVYLPHSFNFSGNLFIVPAESVCKINANPAEVMKFIVSGGHNPIEEKEENEKDTTQDSCNK